AAGAVPPASWPPPPTEPGTRLALGTRFGSPACVVSPADGAATTCAARQPSSAGEVHVCVVAACTGCGPVPRDVVAVAVVPIVLPLRRNQSDSSESKIGSRWSCAAAGEIVTVVGSWVAAAPLPFPFPFPCAEPSLNPSPKPPRPAPTRGSLVLASSSGSESAPRSSSRTVGGCAPPNDGSRLGPVEMPLLVSAGAAAPALRTGSGGTPWVGCGPVDGCTGCTGCGPVGVNDGELPCPVPEENRGMRAAAVACEVAVLAVAVGADSDGAGPE